MALRPVAADAKLSDRLPVPFDFSLCDEEDCVATPSAPAVKEAGEKLDLPSGYRFSPLDLDLVRHYLLPKILGNKPAADAICDIDLYKYDPEQLPFGAFRIWKRNEGYFFTRRETSLRRTAVNGYWKATGCEKKIVDEGELVGFMRTLVFHWSKTTRGRKTRWVMSEYRINPDIIPGASQNESLMAKIESYVMCRIWFNREEYKGWRLVEEDSGGSTKSTITTVDELSDGLLSPRKSRRISVEEDSEGTVVELADVCFLRESFGGMQSPSS